MIIKSEKIKMYPSIKKYCCPKMEEICTSKNFYFDHTVPNNLLLQALLCHHTFTTKSLIALRYCPFCGEKIVNE